METLAPSPAHLALIAQRRDALRAALARVLPPAARFVGEIGCGHGHFLTAYAAAHPGELCLGIDLIGERIARATRKRDRAKLSNLHFFHADAHDFLAALPADASFSAVIMLFPDPWPKRRHHKNRLLQPEFLDALAARAGQGTRLYFRTDHRGYFAHATAVLAAHPAWRMEPAAPWIFETETVFQARAPAYQSLVAQRAPRSLSDFVAPDSKQMAPPFGGQIGVGSPNPDHNPGLFDQHPGENLKNSLNGQSLPKWRRHFG